MSTAQNATGAQLRLEVLAAAGERKGYGAQAIDEIEAAAVDLLDNIARLNAMDMTSRDCSNVRSFTRSIEDIARDIARTVRDSESR